MKGRQAWHDLFKLLLTCPTLNADSLMIFSKIQWLLLEKKSSTLMCKALTIYASQNLTAIS